MEEKKNIAITLQEAKEWYKGTNPTLKELALKAFTKEELEKQELPKTWEEHCIMHSKNGTLCYYIDTCSAIVTHYHGKYSSSPDRNLCQTKEDAEAFLALMQLRALWHDYIGDFEFNWKHNDYYGVYHNTMEQIIIDICLLPKPFCFPTRKLAEEFITNFKDLFEIAKPLI
jgi:hypothetical protein